MTARTVLIVEDEQVHRALINEILTGFGFTTVLAENGAVALARVDSGQKINLILMDCEMPQMDGFEAARKIRERQARQKESYLPIIAFTSHRDEKSQQKCLASGMDDHLPKDIWLPKWRAVLMEKLCKWLPEYESDIRSRFETPDLRTASDA